MLDHWPLIGRAQELDEAVSLIGGRAYRGIALTGKPGVGKSRLAREVVQSLAGAGWTVRRASATATSRSIPLGAFAQWAEDFDGAPLALARKVIASLTAGAASDRLLVFVDDAHLLDDLSALVVHQLVQTERATAIVTLRTGERAPDAVSALWKDGLLQRRELQPLSHRQTDTLLAAVLGAAPDRHCSDRVWRLTHGNVLFMRQVVEQETRAMRMVTRDGAARWLGDLAVSSSLAELVDAQIGAIPDSVRDVVDFVSVAEPIEWHTLRLLADQSAVEEAEQRELIRTTEDAVYIGHPMYGEVRRDRCGPSRLRRLRGQVAEAMKDSSGTANAVRRGLLWLESDLPPDPDVLLAAANAASSLLDFDTAERLLTAAADAGADATARVQLAYNLFMLQKGQVASEVIDSIGAAETSRSTFINDVIMRAANLLWPLRSPEESWRVIDEALVDAIGAGRHQLLVFRASQLSLAARPVDVLEVVAGIDYPNSTRSGRRSVCARRPWPTANSGSPTKRCRRPSRASASRRSQTRTDSSASRWSSSKRSHSPRRDSSAKPSTWPRTTARVSEESPLRPRLWRQRSSAWRRWPQAISMEP